jgi:NAD-dependent deacetylase
VPEELPSRRMLEDQIERARMALKNARSVVVFTGAGISAESGIPTYRSGPDALWSAEKFERFANPRGYRKHLPASYEWYRARAFDAATAEPNAGHLAIARLSSYVVQLLVVTQNVDGLHVRAGSRDVIELHGNLREARCSKCDGRMAWSKTPERPICAECGGMLRPDVVMFEEMLSERDLDRARNAAAECDVLVSVGTSNVVWPAKELPLIALDSGATVLIVNTDLTGQPTGHRVIELEGTAGAVLPRLLDARALF